MSGGALPEAVHQECLAHLQALLRIDTSNPPGNERPAAEYVRDVLAREGIAAQLFEPAPGRANLVARLRSRGAAAPLLLSSHLDVVPVERERWSVEPFGGEVREGAVWGRGAVDMKGMTALELTSLLLLHRSRAPLARDVILLCLADEEAGMEYGSRWMVEHAPEAIRAGWCLNEVGGFSSSLGGQTVYPIGVAEKGFVWLELSAEGMAGHGSLPPPSAAIGELARALVRLGRRPLARHLHPAARRFIAEAAAAAGGLRGLVLRALLHPILAPLALRLIAAAEPDKARALSAMLHLTVSPTVLRAGNKENVIPSVARAVLDCRFPPGMDAETAIAAVRRRVGPRLGVRELARGRPTQAPTATALFRLLCETVERRDPGARAVPWLNVGFTDAAELSRLGICCYGFFPLKLPPELPFAALLHGHDERLPLAALRWGLETFYEVVHAFATSAQD
ncbi:MAG: hypothetical protein KatS3mg102_1195 [Planctomycetota bacterium]|nr:MAG: hypothetical protein KatS3mg102_1195 [Planctomycetota bacterium]